MQERFLLLKETPNKEDVMFIDTTEELDDDLIVIDEDIEVDMDSWWRDIGGEG